MPIRKYRDVSEMDDTWYAPGDPALFAAIRRVWSFGERLIQPRFPRGVHKLRSWDELVALEDAWDAANFAAYHARERR